MPPPAADRIEKALSKTSESTAGIFVTLARITIKPPARYSPTFSGDSFSAALAIALIPPMITSQVITAMTMPETIFGMPTTL